VPAVLVKDLGITSETRSVSILGQVKVTFVGKNSLISKSVDIKLQSNNVKCLLTLTHVTT